MIGNEKVIDIDTYADEYSKKLHEVLTDIFEPVLSFEPTEHKDRCTLCPYNKLCGK
jgi:CRISPR/Cas system-associated exonuclease Cas4 (RecB family)